MGVPTSEVGYTSATTVRGDHEVPKGHVVAFRWGEGEREGEGQRERRREREKTNSLMFQTFIELR
jgi:hypothetical protein